MFGRRFLLIALFAATGVLALAPGGAESQTDPAAAKARLKKLDAGPKVIDVSKYPADEQAGYKLFRRSCVQCHTPARAINSSYVLPGEWERYIKRMLFKPNSKLKEADGKVIYRFLAYDSSVRKADSLRVHLSQLSPEDRADAVERIKAINPTYRAKQP